MKKIFEIMSRLREAKIYFEMSSHRDGYVMLSASVPGERWEIEISDDGTVDYEIFSSDGEMRDELFLEEKIRHFAD
jgi:hypothetical protein